MLRFLTNKLKTQSLNEEPQIDKTQEDHDSGTESDEEAGDTSGSVETNIINMEHQENCEWTGDQNIGAFSLNQHSGGLNLNSFDGNGPENMALGNGGRDSVNSQFESGYIDSALPSDSDHAYDHHSSEEELEVINSSCNDIEDFQTDDTLLEDDDPRGPGSENKRKWSQVSSNRMSVESTSSSDLDEEVQGLLRPLSTPVEFCTSPPVDAHKPSRSQSPPPKLFLFSSENGGGRVNNIGQVAIHSSGVFRGLRKCDQNGVDHHHILRQSPYLVQSNVTTPTSDPHDGAEESQPCRSQPADSSTNERTHRREGHSRKRHRHNPRHIQRPWLDFEKMQQLKARSVTTWRSGGELSLYCS